MGAMSPLRHEGTRPPSNTRRLHDLPPDEEQRAIGNALQRSGRELVSVPYSLEINDKPACEKRNRTADEFRDMIERQFEVL
jgi:hypothetical protein